jgi:hypothetical protein
VTPPVHFAFLARTRGTSTPPIARVWRPASATTALPGFESTRRTTAQRLLDPDGHTVETVHRGRATRASVVVDSVGALERQLLTSKAAISGL